MNSNTIFCPRCGSESSGGIRYCRQCGTNLHAVDHLLTDLDRAQEAEPSAPSSANPLKELQQKAIWIGVRGLVTLLIAVPVFLLLLLAAIGGGGLIALSLALFLLIFIGLGIEDFVKIYSMLRDPHAALAELNEQKEAERKRDAPAEPETKPQIEGSKPPSVTEHTTFPLQEPPEKTTTATAGSKE